MSLGCIVSSDSATDPVAVNDPSSTTPGPPTVVRIPKVAGDRVAKASSDSAPMGATKPPVAAAVKPVTAPLANAVRSLGAKKPIASVANALTAIGGDADGRRRIARYRGDADRLQQREQIAERRPH
jgi:hypothetical protein